MALVRFATPVIAAPPVADLWPTEWGRRAIFAGWLAAGLATRCGRRAGLEGWCAGFLATVVVLVSAGIDCGGEDEVDDDLPEPQAVAVAASAALAASTANTRGRVMTLCLILSGPRASGC